MYAFLYAQILKELDFSMAFMQFAQNLDRIAFFDTSILLVG